jgi:hypothetical protein
MATIKGANSAAAGFEITNSLNFESSNEANSAWLYKTWGSAGNQKTYTTSVWFNVDNKNSNKTIFGAGQWPAEPYAIGPQFEGVAAIRWSWRIAGTSYVKVRNGALSHSTWYHAVTAVDTTASTAADRIKLYIDGSRLTDFSYNSGDMGLNLDTGMSAAHQHYIGYEGGLSRWYDGQLAEINVIDGAQLAPTEFGESIGGTWKAIEYEGDYGTNGDHLDFKDGSDLGGDVSGNGNDWSLNNLDANDLSTDVPPYKGD